MSINASQKKAQGLASNLVVNILGQLKYFRSGKSSERENIISRDLSRLSKNNTNLRHSLEPLQLQNNTSDSESSIERINKVAYSKITRTGYIPLIPETGFKKKHNQDSSVVLHNFMGITDNYFFGVFDGHGTNGAKVSAFLKKTIPDGIKMSLSKNNNFSKAG